MTEDTKPGSGPIAEGNSVLEVVPTTEEKPQVNHHESMGRTEKNVGLRIDGDDLDHEHEPKVGGVILSNVRGNGNG